MLWCPKFPQSQDLSRYNKVGHQVGTTLKSASKQRLFWLLNRPNYRYIYIFHFETRGIIKWGSLINTFYDLNLYETLSETVCISKLYYN